MLHPRIDRSPGFIDRAWSRAREMRLSLPPEIPQDCGDEFVGGHVRSNAVLLIPGEWLPAVVPLTHLLVADDAPEWSRRMSFQSLVEADVELVDARDSAMVVMQAFERFRIVAQVEYSVEDDVVAEVECLTCHRDDHHAGIVRSLSPIDVVQHLTSDVVLMDECHLSAESGPEFDRRRRLSGCRVAANDHETCGCTSD